MNTELYPQRSGPPSNPLRRIGRDVRFNRSHAAEFPPGVPWRDIGFHLRAVRNPMREFIADSERFGGVFSAPLLHQRQVVVVSPAATHEMLVAKAASFRWRGGNFGDLIPLLGDGLLTTDGPEHDVARKLVMPAFHRQRVEQSLEIIFEEAEAALEGQRAGEIIDANCWARELTMRIAMRVLIGFDTGERARADLVARLFEQGLAFYGSGPGRLLRGPGSPWRRLHAARTQLHAIVQQLVEVRRGEEGTAQRPDVLSTLVEARLEDGSRFSDRQIRDQMMTLLFAGHDSASSAIAFLFYELARNSAEQEVLQVELDGLAAGRPGFEQLHEGSQALARAIEEALRLYPPVWIGARRAIQEVELGDRRIPAGAYVNYVPYATHHLPEIYPEPEQFRPARFLPDARRMIPQGGYVPFGGGQRICVGKRFGLTVVHAAATAVLGRFRLAAVPSSELKIGTIPTLTPLSGALVRLEEQV